MSKHQIGDIILYWEGIIFVYGENATPNIEQAKEMVDEAFELTNYRKVNSKYYRWGFPTEEFNDRNGRELYESKKGIRGSFPLTDWQ